MTKRKKKPQHIEKYQQSRPYKKTNYHPLVNHFATEKNTTYVLQQKNHLKKTLSWYTSPKPGSVGVF